MHRQTYMDGECGVIRTFSRGADGGLAAARLGLRDATVEGGNGRTRNYQNHHRAAGQEPAPALLGSERGQRAGDALRDGRQLGVGQALFQIAQSVAEQVGDPGSDSRYVWTSARAVMQTTTSSRASA